MFPRGPKQDLLTPHFTFNHLLRDRLESDLFKDILRLRYEVYCLECHFLEAREYEEGLESDDYDVRSFHVGAQQNSDGMLVGTVRLVQAEETEIFPFEEHCKVFEDFSFPLRAECAEVSRLVVRKTFRRRPGDTLQGISREFQEKGSLEGISPETEQRPGPHRRSNSPQILLGMYREMYRYSRKTGIRYWFAAMEKSLARSLDRMGFHFVPAGPETDYYGPVTPYIVDIWEASDRLHRSNQFLAHWFNDEPIPLWLLLKTWLHTKFVAGGKR